ncbi:MAG: FHA domain-containing protein [Bdellovibrionia bacterium]
MWAIRILTGPQAGQIFPLQVGKNTLGRSPQCQIRLSSVGVSKEHAELHVQNDRVVITDLKSSNGTFINGVRTQQSPIRMGDKVGIHDILIDLILQAPKNTAPHVGTGVSPAVVGGAPSPSAYPQMPIPQPHVQQNYYQPQTAGVSSGGAAPAYVPPQPPLQALQARIQEYMDRVALPAIYQLAKVFEFKVVILGFVGVFIFVTTLLSMIPMVTITREAIVLESKRRAQSLARSLADLNQAAYLRQELNSLAVDSIQIQEGVEQALIVEQSSGNIVAPASRAGGTADIPFISKIRAEGRGFVGQTGNIIVSSFPIGAFDSSTGEQAVRAHAVVVYDISALEFDDGRALSLFLQTLVIASVVGLLIYYLLYSLIERPIKALNAELDLALREKRDTTQSEFNYPALQALVGNINSLLSRYVHGEGSGDGSQFVNRDGEMENLVLMMGLPGLVFNSEGRIIAVNSGFAQLARVEPQQLQGQTIHQIPDSALQQNLNDLKIRAMENPRQMHNDQLEFGGHPCIMNCQAFTQSGDSVEFFIVTVAPLEAS